MKTVVFAVVVVAGMSCTSAAQTPSGSVKVQIQTGFVNNASTRNRVYIAFLVAEGRDTRLVARPLKVGGVGAVREHEFELDCDVRDIVGVRLGVGPGGDAWKCAGIRLQFEQQNRRSQVYTFVLPEKHRWFSAARDDGGKHSRALQYRHWPIAKPRLSERNASL